MKSCAAAALAPRRSARVPLRRRTRCCAAIVPVRARPLQHEARSGCAPAPACTRADRARRSAPSLERVVMSARSGAATVDLPDARAPDHRNALAGGMSSESRAASGARVVAGRHAVELDLARSRGRRCTRSRSSSTSSAARNHRPRDRRARAPSRCGFPDGRSAAQRTVDLPGIHDHHRQQAELRSPLLHGRRRRRARARCDLAGESTTRRTSLEAERGCRVAKRSRCFASSRAARTPRTLNACTSRIAPSTSPLIEAISPSRLRICLDDTRLACGPEAEEREDRGDR